MLKTSHVVGGQKAQVGPTGLTWHLGRGIDATGMSTGKGVRPQTETDVQPNDAKGTTDKGQRVPTYIEGKNNERLRTARGDKSFIS